MIFVTVGTQLPFDRLVCAVDQWAEAEGRRDVFAQTGATRYRPRAIECVASLPPEVFRERFEAASVVVAHAGMGTILSALELGKPVLVMPRRAALNEHRNDHQLATVDRFRSTPGVWIAEDEEQVADRLEAIGGSDAGHRIGAVASPGLVAAIRGFIVEEAGLAPATRGG